MALRGEIYTSLSGFIVGLFSFIVVVTFEIPSERTLNHEVILHCIYLLLISIVLKFLLDDKSFEVIIRSLFLGVVFSFGFSSWLLNPILQSFGLYCCVMASFHFSEYLVTAYSNPKSLSLDSYLINHSLEYGIAAAASWIEFYTELYVFPDLKCLKIISYFGLLICICGEIIRKLAMITAGTNFNHRIQMSKEDSHVLVTSGIYNYFRHPSYVGWFYWSIGTQVVLCNPLCFIGYTWASWRFFSDRIIEEEITLINFFKEDYLRYQKKVKTGLPYINGFI